jgi:hypothetical protein
MREIGELGSAFVGGFGTPLAPSTSATWIRQRNPEIHPYTRPQPVLMQLAALVKIGSAVVNLESARTLKKMLA